MVNYHDTTATAPFSVDRTTGTVRLCCKGSGLRHLLAAQAAFGMGETYRYPRRFKRSDTAIWKGIALGLVTIGLIGYVLWRFVQAIKDPENRHGRQRFGTASRLRSQRLDLRWFSS